MNEKVRAKALATLDGMEQIVRNEMMERGDYVSDSVDVRRSDAICGGRKACLLGSAWIAYGIKPDVSVDYFGKPRAALPGIDEDEREEFLRNRPALKAVYSALNATAEERLKRSWRSRHFESPAESYFEDRMRSLPRTVLLRFIADARQRVEAA